MIRDSSNQLVSRDSGGGTSKVVATFSLVSGINESDFKSRDEKVTIDLANRSVKTP